MDATIETHGLRKRYGATVALDDLTLSIRPGHVTGFVGPNGAGKTTTMHVLLGLSRQDAGEALVAGRPYASLQRPLAVVGALLEPGAVYPGRSARAHLRWIAESNRIGRGRVDDVLRMVGLGDAARRRVGTFSLGMKQRLGVAAALLGDPAILLLDEPTNGLDPEGIHWMRTTLRDLAADGRTVLVSSHLMSELEGTADQLVVIGRGRLLADIAVDELIASTSNTQVEIRTPEAAQAMAVLSSLGAKVVSRNTHVVIADGLAAAQVAGALAAAGIPLDGLTSNRGTLEDAYFALTRDAGVHIAAPLRAEGTAA